VEKVRVGSRPNPVATVALDGVLGALAGAAVGGTVGLANGDDTRASWQRDVGTGALVGFFVGAATGGVLTYVQWGDARAIAYQRRW